MHINAKKVALTGLLAAFAVVLLVLSAVIEMSSLFFITAAAFCVGIVLREWGIRIGAAFLMASFLVGLIVAPNRLYCITYLMMGVYLVLSEILWEKVARSWTRNKNRAVWIGRFVIYNAILIPILILFPSLIIAKKVTGIVFVIVFAMAQIGLVVFEKAYEYFQVYIWGRIRGRLLR